MDKKIGLFLTGGGARGAYQAGVLKGISTFLPAKRNPFPVLTGTSAGAINCAYISSHIQQKQFTEVAKDLATLWENIRTNDILQTNPFKLFSNGSKWLSILMGGGVKLNDSHNLSLLNNKNLEKFLQKNIAFENIESAIQNKIIEAIGITTLSYEDSTTKTYFSSSTGIPNWTRNLREGINEKINIDHIMSSTSIPILFPSHQSNGKYFGDGSIRNFAPLSASIKLGAEKILIINVKAKRTPIKIDPRGPGLAQILGTLLHGLMLDNLDADIERVETINSILANNSSFNEHKQIQTLLLSPSENIGHIAAEEFHHLPASLKFLFSGLGKPTEAADLISYFLFEKAYTSRLIRLGYNDAVAQQEKILNFLLAN